MISGYFKKSNFPHGAATSGRLRGVKGGKLAIARDSRSRGRKDCTYRSVFVIVTVRFTRHPPASDLLVGLFQPAFDLLSTGAGFFLPFSRAGCEPASICGVIPTALRAGHRPETAREDDGAAAGRDAAGTHHPPMAGDAAGRVHRAAAIAVVTLSVHAYSRAGGRHHLRQRRSHHLAQPRVRVRRGPACGLRARRDRGEPYVHALASLSIHRLWRRCPPASAARPAPCAVRPPGH
jgi:hypothetical protein